ncbi:MAG: hypothetical protein IH991_06810 [Planctomycetes bacterium]|nr:hypothetical protein [Planctomycetota bacterium]
MMARILVCAAFFLFGVDFAEGQITFSDPLADPANAQIDRLLDQQRDMLFNDATLVELADFLTSQGIPTLIDERALDDVGFDTDSRFTFRQHDVRLRDGLKLALRTLQLSFTVRRGGLVITTHEELEYEMITKVYDVRHLVELEPVLIGGGLGGPTQFAYRYDFDSLINTIVNTIGTDSWEEVGGPGSINPYYTRRMRVIVVAQTYDMYRQIQALLNNLAMHGRTTPLSGARFSAASMQRPSSFASSPAVQPSRPRVGIRSSQLRTTGQ